MQVPSLVLLCFDHVRGTVALPSARMLSTLTGCRKCFAGAQLCASSHSSNSHCCQLSLAPKLIAKGCPSATDFGPSLVENDSLRSSLAITIGSFDEYPYPM